MSKAQRRQINCILVNHDCTIARVPFLTLWITPGVTMLATICVSHPFRHNPRNNTFTSVYETPININAKKQSKASSEVRGHPEQNHSSSMHAIQHVSVLWLTGIVVAVYGTRGKTVYGCVYSKDCYLYWTPRSKKAVKNLRFDPEHLYPLLLDHKGLIPSLREVVGGSEAVVTEVVWNGDWLRLFLFPWQGLDTPLHLAHFMLQRAKIICQEKQLHIPSSPLLSHLFLSVWVCLCL